MYSPTRQTEQAPREKQSSFLLEVAQFVLIALFIILPFRLFVAQPFVVNGASMTPTFHSGEYLIVDQLTYNFEKPARGSVVIFEYPNDPSKYFIKRIIGLPGETVQIEDGRVTIHNTDYPGGFQLDEPYVAHHSGDDVRITLSDDEYFVLGDNRAGSSDSRSWGALHQQYLVGRPFVRLLPVSELDIFPGSIRYNH